jgi:ABC-type arginine transport system permease subunit
VAGILIYLLLTAVSNLLLRHWHDSARRREG